MRTLKTLALVLAAALSVVACGQPATAAPVKNVAVTLSDQAIQLSEASIASGRVAFTVANKGSLVHNLVLLKTDIPQDKIPADSKDSSKVQENGSVAAAGQLAIGESKTFTRDLDPGNYVLVCNEPGHYLMGMHIAFTVK
jgi:uncharacterized cupredoxin-like copper-binding protein